MQRLYRSTLAGAPAILLLLAACGGGGGGSSTSGSPNPTPTPPAIAIVEASPTLSVGQGKTFTATIGGIPSSAVVWSVVEAGGGTISPAGTYMAPAAPGSFTVKATSQQDTSRTATVAVTVVALPSITAFSAASTMVWPSQGTNLTAVFQGGAGSISPAVGTVVSGQAVPVSPNADTTYTLIVTNAAGATQTASVALSYQTQAPRIAALSLAPGKNVEFGTDVTASWTLADGPATQLSFNGASVLGQSQASFRPSRRFPLVLAAANPVGSHNLAGLVVVRGIEPFVGSTWGAGHVDGPLAQARLANHGLPARDAAGNIYVPDAATHTLRRISPAGVVTTLAGRPFTASHEDGTGANARLSYPQAVCLDAAGNVILVEGSQRVRRVTADGTVSTLAGQYNTMGNPGDGQGPAAMFSNPCGVAMTAGGDLLVVQSGAIRKINPAGMVTTVAGVSGEAGIVDGIGAAARIGMHPKGVVLDRQRNRLYFAEQDNHVLRCLELANLEVKTLAGNGTSGSQDGTGAAARFNGPSGIDLDAEGRVLIADQNNATVRRFDPVTGQVSTVAGLPDIFADKDGPVAEATLYNPTSVLALPDGAILVFEAGSGVVRKVHQGQVTTFLGQPYELRVADGQLGQARFNRPIGLAYDSRGNLLTADSMGGTVRRIAPNGTVVTVAGAPDQRGYVDGPGTSARFGRLFNYALAIDGQDNLFLTDYDGHTLRRVAADGTVSTFAGSPGQSGSTDGPAAEARFKGPMAVVRDAQGNLFLSDFGNHTIRKVAADGTVSTFAGAAGQVGGSDGIGLAARFFGPAGLAIDAAGNLYVMDSGNRKVRKITPAGVVSTLPIQDKLSNTGGLWAAADGTLYIASFSTNRILKVTPAGVLSTFLGTLGAYGTEGAALPGRLHSPTSLLINKYGDVLLTGLTGVYQATQAEAGD